MQNDESLVSSFYLQIPTDNRRGRSKGTKKKEPTARKKQKTKKHGKQGSTKKHGKDQDQDQDRKTKTLLLTWNLSPFRECHF